MPKKKSVIGELLDLLRSGQFQPERYLRAKRLISHADENAEQCRHCSEKNAVGGCGLCCDCATVALQAAIA